MLTNKIIYVTVLEYDYKMELELQIFRIYPELLFLLIIHQ